jgi:CheY-like chemotaxis protein
MSKKRKILLIDDDEVEALILNREIGRSGRNLEFVHEMNAETAFEGLCHDRPAFENTVIILLDLSMPGMNGFEFLRKRQSEAKIAAIPVIIASNSRAMDDICEALALGAEDFFIKDVRAGQYEPLFAKIDKFLLVPA